MKTAITLLMACILSAFAFSSMNSMDSVSQLEKNSCRETKCDAGQAKEICTEICRTTYLHHSPSVVIASQFEWPLIILVHKEHRQEVSNPYLIFRPPIQFHA